MGKLGDSPDAVEGHSPTAVVADRESLCQLAAESEFRAMASLHAEDPFAAGVDFVGITPDELVRGVTSPERERFLRIALRLLSGGGRSETVVVRRVRARDDVRALLAWLRDFAAAASECVQQDRLIGANWTLVVIEDGEGALCRDGVADLEQAMRLSLAGRDAGGESPESLLVRRCFVMTDALKVAAGADPAFARDSWPCAVGRLLVHLRGLLIHGKPPPPRGIHAWMTQALVIDLEDPGDASIEDAFRSAMRGRQGTPTAGLPGLAWEIGSVVPTKAPLNRDEAAEEVAPGLAAGVVRPARFSAAGPGDGPDRIRERVADWRRDWRAGIRAGDRRLLESRAREAGESAVGSRDRRSKILHGIWDFVVRDRAAVDVVAGGQWLSRGAGQDLPRMLERQEESWRRILAHDAGLNRSLKQTRDCGAELRAAREGFVGLGWRVLSAACVCLFVGILTATVVESVSGSSFRAAVTAGFVASMGATIVAIALFLVESVAGDRAAAVLSREIELREKDISTGIAERRAMVAAAFGVAAESGRLSLVASTQALAHRLLMIRQECDREAAATWASASGSGHAWTPYRRLATERISIQGRDSRGSLRRKLEDESHRLAIEVQRRWETFASQHDRQRLGAYRMFETQRALRETMDAVRSRLVGLAVAHRFEVAPKAVEDSLRRLGRPDRGDLPLLSVRTALHSGSRTAFGEVVWTAPQVNETFRGSESEHPSLPLLTGSPMLGLLVVMCGVRYDAHLGWIEVEAEGGGEWRG